MTSMREAVRIMKAQNNDCGGQELREDYGHGIHHEARTQAEVLWQHL